MKAPSALSWPMWTEPWCSLETLFVRSNLLREGLANPLFWLGMTVVIAAIEAADGGGPVARGRNSERVEETLGQRRRV